MPCSFSGFSRPDFSTDPGHSILVKIGEVKSNHFFVDFVDLWMCGFVPKSTNPQILPPLQTAITQSIAYRFG